MKDLHFNISYGYLLMFLVLGICLFFLFYSLKKVFSRYEVKSSLARRFERLLPLMEGISWLTFILWSVQYVFQSIFTYTLILLILLLAILVWIAWFAIRDFTAGIILKFQQAFEIGGRVKIQNVAGRVKKLGYLSMKIENYQGEIISIPYSNVSQEIRIQPSQEEVIRNQTFQIQVPKRTSLGDTVERLRITILNAPWVAIHKRPHIKVLEETEEFYSFEVIVYSLHEKYFQKIKNYLLEIMNT